MHAIPGNRQALTFHFNMVFCILLPLLILTGIFLLNLQTPGHAHAHSAKAYPLSASGPSAGSIK